MARVIQAVALGTIGVLTSCSHESLELSRRNEVVVIGEVRSAAGKQIADAQIVVQAAFVIEQCQGGFVTAATTNQSGTFAMTMRSGPLTLDACLRITVHPPVAEGLESREVEVRDVTFTSPPARDTARVTVILQPRT